MAEIMTLYDLTKRDEPLIIDVSKHNGTPNWPVTLKYCLGAVVRCTIGNYYKDPLFDYNWSELGRLNGIRAPYMVLNPKTGGGREQAEYMLKNMPADELTMAPWVDVELYSDISPNQYEDLTGWACDTLYSRTGISPVIYSRANFIDTYLTGNQEAPGWYNNFGWALAQYLSSGMEHMGPVRLPKGVSAEKVKFHQTSCTGPGKAMGMGSVAVDTDRWLGGGGLKGLCEYAGVEMVEEVPGEDAAVSDLTVIATELTAIRMLMEEKL